MENKNTPQTTQGAGVAKTTTTQLFDLVSNKINSLITEGGITTAPNYDAGNAMRSAWLILQDQKDRNGKSVLEVCTQASIANALMKMVVQGMNPAKSQCYFIPYGDQLNYQRSYMGSYALAKRVSNLKEVNAQVIYEDDVKTFNYEIDTNTGRTKIIEHGQKFDSIDISKIKGGYAICLFNDGTSDAVIMTIEQIKKAWEQGATKGQSPAHKNFTDEMAKKTIRARAIKLIINSSDDSDLMQEDEVQDAQEVSSKKIDAKANKETFEIPTTPLNIDAMQKEDTAPAQEVAPEMPTSSLFEEPKQEAKF